MHSWNKPCCGHGILVDACHEGRGGRVLMVRVPPVPHILHTQVSNYKCYDGSAAHTGKNKFLLHFIKAHEQQLSRVLMSIYIVINVALHEIENNTWNSDVLIVIGGPYHVHGIQASAYCEGHGGKVRKVLAPPVQQGFCKFQNSPRSDWCVFLTDEHKVSLSCHESLLWCPFLGSASRPIFVPLWALLPNMKEHVYFKSPCHDHEILEDACHEVHGGRVLMVRVPPISHILHIQLGNKKRHVWAAHTCWKKFAAVYMNTWLWSVVP